jgi:hypothetical protein
VTKTKPIDPFPVSHSISVLPLPSLSVTRSGFAVIAGARETRFELLPDAFCWAAAGSIGAVPKYTTRAAIIDPAFTRTDQLRVSPRERLSPLPVMRPSQLRINELAVGGGSEFLRMTACEARSNQ